MSRITRHTPVTTQGLSQSKSTMGQPVSEVLGRIQVRNPLHKPSGIRGRRITDYETHVPFLIMTTVFTLIVLFANPFGTRLRRPAPLMNTAPTVPAMAVQGSQESLSIPQQLHSHPQMITSTPKQTLGATPPAPANRPDHLRADFLGPRMIEFQWDAIGPQYTYRLYRSQDPTFRNPTLLSKVPLRSPSMAWFPDDDMEQTWVAVKGVDSRGHETAFSDPLLVQLPPA